MTQPKNRNHRLLNWPSLDSDRIMKIIIGETP